jgi:hypothetical protein
MVSVYTCQNSLEVIIRIQNISMPKNFPKDQVKEIFGGRWNWWVNPKQFVALTARFEQLISEINAAKSR